MTQLLASQAFWLLGIDDQLRRPKAPHVRIGLAAAALVDVIDAGGARWTGPAQEPGIEVVPLSTDNELLATWHARLDAGVGSAGCRAVFAVDALYEHAWTEAARSLLQFDWSREHRLPVLRRLSYGPTADGLQVAAVLRDEARAAVAADRLPEGVALTVVAAAESVGVSEYVLSDAWAADLTIGLQATHALAADPLSQRLVAATKTLLSAATSLRSFT